MYLGIQWLVVKKRCNPFINIREINILLLFLIWYWPDIWSRICIGASQTNSKYCYSSESVVLLRKSDDLCYNCVKQLYGKDMAICEITWWCQIFSLKILNHCWALLDLKGGGGTFQLVPLPYPTLLVTQNIRVSFQNAINLFFRERKERLSEM